MHKAISLNSIICGAALVAALVIPLTQAVTLADCKGHMQTADPTAVCYDRFGAHAHVAQADSQSLAQAAKAAAGRQCYAPADLPKGTVPTWAVMRRLDGTIVGEPFSAAWAEATSGKAWTISVCR